MARYDVPPDDMFLSRSTPDPIDGALHGESDDAAVSALVGDLRAAYLPEGTRPRSAALAAFAGTGDGAPVGAVRPQPATTAPAVRPPVPIGRRAAVAAAAFAATMTGKVVLGGAVAAATLGGLHATEVVDVPLLPRAPQSETVPATVPEVPDAVDPLDVLVGPPAQAPAGELERAPEQDAPAPVLPAPVAPHPSGSDRAPDTAGESDTDDAPAGQVTPPTTAPASPPPTAGPPGSTTAEPDQPAPGAGAPKDTSGDAPVERDAEEPATADREPPAPPADEQRNPARS